MSKYLYDLQDTEFNLFEVLKVQDIAPGTSVDDLKSVLSEYCKFVTNEVAPTRQLSDSQGVHLVDGKVKVPECFRPVKEKFYANGWFGLGMSEDIGGMPVPHAVKVAASGMTCGANVSFEMYPGLTRAALNVILLKGTDKQKDTYVEKIMTGEWGGTMCLTESNAGSDVGNVATTATKLANGRYKIKGTKIFISSGESDLYQNNIHLVLARTPGAAAGTKGLSLFIVPRFKLNDQGQVNGANHVVCTKVEEKMGIHGSATCELNFGLTGECEGELLGQELEGMANMFIMMNEARLMCGMQGESQANLSTMLAWKYATERSQFGAELLTMPDVQRTLLRMRAVSRGMRALLMYTANLFDLAHAGGKGVEAEIALLTPVCKSWCTDEGFKVTVDGVQVHGGYGYCTEYGMEQLVRDSKIATIYEGTNGIQAIDFVTRKVLKDKGEAFGLLGQKIAASLKNPGAKSWPKEVAQIASNLERAAKTLQMLGGLAQQNKVNQVLEHASNFLSIAGNIIISWRLLEHAIAAQASIETTSVAERKQYLRSKIEDFRYFCQCQLSQNEGHFYAMNQSDFSVTMASF